MPDTDIEPPLLLGIYANGSPAAPFNLDTLKEAGTRGVSGSTPIDVVGAVGNSRGTTSAWRVTKGLADKLDKAGWAVGALPCFSEPSWS